MMGKVWVARVWRVQSPFHSAIVGMAPTKVEAYKLLSDYLCKNSLFIFDATVQAEAEIS